MTTVYLDTSVAMNEAFLRSPYSEAFLKACAILQYTVVIPEIVVDELKGNFPKKVQEKLISFDKVSKELGKLVDGDFPEIHLFGSIDKYNKWLKEFLDEYGVVVAPYPDVTAKELVDKSYTVKKPFKQSGEGYKDYVVWKTILGCIASDEAAPPNIFLTNNTKDFCDADEGGNPFLHPDLSEQVIDPARTPKVYTSIKSAFTSELSPNLEGMTLDDIPDLTSQDIDFMAGKYLLEDIPSRSLYGLEGVPFSNDISISSVGAHSIESVTLKKVDDEIVITALGRVEVEVDGFIDKFDFYHTDSEDSKIYIVDGNWNDHVMMVSSTVETDFELTIFYSTKINDATGHEVSLPQEIESDWPYK